MKLQHLAIIFVIIMLPISMVITYYIQTQIDTITLQTQYNSKLQTATHDAIKAFQLNTINNKYSTVSDSKIRDIEASISTFYNSLGTELGASGYDENTLKEYIPAMVYTMHDGYYIYSKYYNNTINDYQFGLRPYIYYSCRYKKGTNDFVVNYSLDNSITIYGVVGGEYVTKSAPLINPNLVKNIKKNANEDVISLEYDGVVIEKEILKEQLVLLDDLAVTSKPVVYEYITYGNKRVYKDSKGYFWNTNSSKQYITDKATLEFAKKWTENGHLYSNSAIQYFVEGYNFSVWVNTNLSDITQKHAIDASGNQITDFAINTGDSKIFKTDSNNNPLLDDSVFNQNRISVIRKSIESNLSAAIANFGAGADYEFVMPIFTEDDWDKLVNSVSVASFMQGVPIGAKYYNNYCIITNNKNEEHVSKESIYIITNDMNNNDALITTNEVHRASSTDVIDNRKNVIGAYKNVDFEKQTVVLEDSSTECYYHPHANDKCYECMVNVAESYNIDDIITGEVKVYDLNTDTYVDSSINITNLRQIYLTALARERYDLNNIIGDNNDYTEGTEHIQKENITITLNINTWTNQNVIATASTKLTGVTLQTSKDGSTWQNITSQTFDKNGTMYAKLLDATGKEIGYATRVITNIDKTPPTKTTVNLNGYTSGTWTKSNVKITATAQDFESLVSYYQYTTDGGKTILTMPNPYLISWNGQWNFLVRAVDGAGNIGEWSNQFTVLRDALVPSVPAVIYVSGQNSHKWQNNINIKLSSRSEGSAIVRYEVDTNNDGIVDRKIGVDGKFIPENGYSSCNTRFRAVNSLGNASEWSPSVHIHMDTQKPSKTTVDLNGYTVGNWKEATVKATLKATDNAKIGYYEYTTDKYYIYTVPTNPWNISIDKEGIYYVRVRDEAGNIGEWSAPFEIRKGNITLEAKAYIGNYDGKSHNAVKVTKVVPTDAKLEYSINGGPYSTTIPTVTGVSTYTVSIRASRIGYITKTITKTVTIVKGENTLLLSAYSGEFAYPDTGTFTVIKNVSGGNLSVKSSNNAVATVSISGNTVTINALSIGTATITVTSAETANYEAKSVTYKVTVTKPKILTIISDGNLLLPEYIVSDTGTTESGHNTSSTKATTHAALSYYSGSRPFFGGSCGGVYNGGKHDCNNRPYVNITLTLDDSLVGRECTLEGYYYYAARYWGVDSAYIKCGSQTMSFSENNKAKINTKTFTLDSNKIQMYIKFKCDNDSWSPSGYIGIRSLVIK